MKIVITGGAGFIGSALVRKLLISNYKVSVIDNLVTGSLDNLNGIDVDFIECDYGNISILEKVLKKDDVIVHLGAQGSVPKSLLDPVSMFETNLMKSINLLNACRITGSKFIFSSSSSVYGSNSSVVNNEDTKTFPISPYAASKLSFENIINSYVHSFGLNASIFRFFNVYGPRQNPQGNYAAVIPKFINSALNNQTLKIFGDGLQTRDFTYVNDVSEIIKRTIDKGIYNNFPINLAWGNRVTLIDLINLLSTYFNRELMISYEGKRVGDIINSSNTSSRVREIYPEFIPTPFHIGISETVNWYKNKLN
jgi:UDP-glucose 4-epimerase